MIKAKIVRNDPVDQAMLVSIKGYPKVIVLLYSGTHEGIIVANHSMSFKHPVGTSSVNWLLFGYTTFGDKVTLQNV
jgi:hypothetical protein